MALLVYPCLMLNYLGQGALMLGHPAAATNPFFLMAPDWARLPLVGIATAATIIASQAVISGAFSVTHQAVQLGFLPRLKTQHTSEKAAGQIYIPAVNWGLLVMVIVLVLGFRESGKLASAYGIAVTGTMLITTMMLAVLVFQVWRWNRLLATATIGLFLLVDSVFFASNITKIPDGGWFPLLVAAVSFTVLTTWAKGRQLMRQRLSESALPLEVFIKSAAASVHRVRGTSVFLSTSADVVPAALLHNLKHNQVLHSRVLILNVKVEEVPHVAAEKRVEVHDAGEGFYRVILHYGYMQEVDIPRDLAAHRDLRRAVQHDEHQLLPRPPEADRVEAARRAWRCGARSCSRGCSRISESAMEFFGCRPTAWSSSAASFRSSQPSSWRISKRMSASSSASAARSFSIWRTAWITVV